MALQPVAIFTLNATISSPYFVNGSTIYSVWDDVQQKVLVQYVKVINRDNITRITLTAQQCVPLSLSANQINGAYVSGSPNDGNRYAYNPKYYTSNYSFCSGTTLNTFSFDISSPLVYPYVSQVLQKNSPSCKLIPSCDIQFTGTPSIAYDGFGVPTVTVQATSSKGPVKYSIDQDADFASMANSNGVFVTNIGQHSIYARDSNDCKAAITIGIPAVASFNEKYRLDYFDIQNNTNARIKIFENGYAGDVITSVEGQDTTIILNKPTVDVNNKYVPIQPSYADVTLTSMSNFQYISLFTQDDRKYQLQYEKPVGTLRWSGFVTPSVFQEQYITPPYASTIRFVDGLARLKDYLFIDDQLNRYYGTMSEIKILAMVLSKTGLKLPILSGINMFEAAMGKTASDDPLAQAYQSLDAFYEDNGTPWNCSDVIAEILKPYGAVIFQDDGFWNILCVEQTLTSYAYRTFDYTGTYTGNGTYNPVKNIDAVNLFFADQSQNLNIIPAYGVINLRHDLAPYPNYLDGGDFRPVDWFGYYYLGWTVYLANAPGASYSPYSPIYLKVRVDPNGNRWNNYGYVSKRATDSLQTNGIKFINIDTAQGYAHRYITMISRVKPVMFQNNDSFDFSINYKINVLPTNSTSVDPFWVRIRYSIYSGTYNNFMKDVNGFYFCPTAGADPWMYNSGYEWNEIYCASYNSDQSFTLSNQYFRNVNTMQADTLIVAVSVEGVYNIDFDLHYGVQTFNYGGLTLNFDSNTFSDVRTIVTYAKPLGTKMRGLRRTNSQNTNYNIVYLELIKWDGSTPWNNNSATQDAMNYSNGYIVPNDFSTSTNPVMWQVKVDKTAFVSNTRYTTNYGAHPDRNPPVMFSENYVDSIVINKISLIYKPNGNDAPKEEDLTINNNLLYKESLDINMKLGDLPDTPIDNGQYIYKNFSRFPNGTPTLNWARNGISESNTRQKILLKSISAQYKYPTFRITGPILNKSDLKFRNTIQIITPAYAFSYANPEFTTSSGWINTGAGASWAIDTMNGWAQCILANGSPANSKLFAQSSLLTLNAGVRINVQFSITRTATNNTSPKYVDFVCGIQKGGLIVQTFTLLTGTYYNDTWSGNFFFNLTADADNIGFYLNNTTGNGGATFNVDYFRVSGATKTRFFTPTGMAIDDRNNSVDCELMELLPTTFSVDGEGSSTVNTGSNFSGDYNNDYGGDFNTYIN